MSFDDKDFGSDDSLDGHSVPFFRRKRRTGPADILKTPRPWVHPAEIGAGIARLERPLAAPHSMQRHPIASRVLGGIATVVLLAGALVLGHSSGLWKVRHTTLASAAPRTVLIAASEKSSPVAAGVIIEQHGLIVTTANSLPARTACS